MSSIDRAHIEGLLADEHLSYRAIADLVGCSDWTVRKVARELAGDERPMKSARNAPVTSGVPCERASSGWLLVIMFALGLAAIVGIALRCGRSPNDFQFPPT